MKPQAFHLHLSPDDVQGATLAFLPGDPARVERIASYLQEPERLASHREFTSYRARLNGHQVMITSTGIGGPSTSICIEELAQLGIKTFLRIGTTGAIQPYIHKADIVITQAAVRLDGAGLHFAPIEFPAVSDFSTTMALVEAARELKFKTHVGVAASSDTFYPGQERYDTYSGRVLPRFKGSLKEWQNMGVLNYEMESATMFVMCQALGLKAGCVLGVIANRLLSEAADSAIAQDAEDRAIRIAVNAAAKILSA